MCGFKDALSNIIPVDWLDPYGRTPFAKDAEMSVDITIVETDDGIRATSVKNPPSSGSSRLIDAIKNALGVDFDSYMPECSSLQAADQVKQKDESAGRKPVENGKIDSSSHGDSGDRDRNPSPCGSRPEPSRQGATEEEDAKEKAPWK